MARKNVLLQMMIEQSLVDIMIQTGSDNVIVDSATNETLATRLASIASKITEIEQSGLTQEAVQSIVDTAIARLIDGAPETYDTLKEIADYISQNQDVVTALNEAIGNKVDKVAGKGLSTNDFTNELLTKLNNIAVGATNVAKSSVNGNILINNVDTTVYTHPTDAGNKHIPVGGTDGQVLGYGGSSGVAQWITPITIVKSGLSAPSDLKDGELFLKLLN